MYAKVSKKGQVTIPKLIREKLHIEKDGAVLFLVEDNEIKLKGVPGVPSEQLAGSLKKYAKQYVSLDEIREKVQDKIATETACEGLSG
jgi:AbrB family looped-hinge helix DNA binding protein